MSSYFVKAHNMFHTQALELIIQDKHTQFRESEGHNPPKPSHSPTAIALPSQSYVFSEVVQELSLKLDTLKAAKSIKLYTTNQPSQKKRVKALHILRNSSTLAIQSASCTGGTTSLTIPKPLSSSSPSGRLRNHHSDTQPATAYLPTDKQSSTIFLPHPSPVQGQVNRPALPQSLWEGKGKSCQSNQHYLCTYSPQVSRCCHFCLHFLQNTLAGKFLTLGTL